MALQSMTTLASITLQEASASVSFSGIPQNYRDLVLVIAGTTNANNAIAIYFNADETGSNYSFVNAGTFGSFAGAGSEAGEFGTAISNGIIQVMDYSATNKHKTVLYRRNNINSNTGMGATRWANTAAITSLKLTQAGSFQAGSTFNLYGRIA
jgi:hypothetical protein